MARKKKENITLENVELKPQVIGTIYNKKSNTFRVFIIFIIFAFVIYYINDISVYINDLIGKVTATSISENAEKSNSNSESTVSNEEDVDTPTLNTYSTDLVINYEDVIVNNFNYANGMLSFSVFNSGTTSIDYSDKKIFIEVYSASNTLLNRYKVDIETIASENTVSFEFAVSSDIYYISFVEKTEDDYPTVNLDSDENGLATLTCTSDNEVIEYTFLNSELASIIHTISYDYEDENYTLYLQTYQSTVLTYDGLSGITASFNNTETEFSAVFNINLASASISNLSNLSKKYYFSYKEEPKVVSFEMTTYGFTCS